MKIQNTQDNASNQETCPCGHSTTHPFVIKNKEHSGIGKILQLIGISSVPVRVQYECIKCGILFGEITDPNILKNFL